MPPESPFPPARSLAALSGWSQLLAWLNWLWVSMYLPVEQEFTVLGRSNLTPLS